MDAGYDYQTVIDSCWRHGIDPVIATRRNSGTRGGTPPDSSKALYRLRSAVEREFRPPQNTPQPRAPPRPRHRPSPTPRRSRAPHQTHSRTQPRTGIKTPLASLLSELVHDDQACEQGFVPLQNPPQLAHHSDVDVLAALHFDGHAVMGGISLVNLCLARIGSVVHGAGSPSSLRKKTSWRSAAKRQ